MPKKKIAKIAHKLWTDEGFKREFMKDLRAGTTISGTVAVIENPATISVITKPGTSVSPIAAISVSKCGAGSGCTNHGSTCDSSSVVANPTPFVIISGPK
jgi:hypothetical protein